jgi:non-ribosomal peptide synthetase-like protein
VGSRSFLGNCAILKPGTTVGDDCLVGVSSCPPLTVDDGTSWLGQPAFELPRVLDRTDPARTTAPSRRLVVARGTMDVIRILIPGTVSVALGALVFLAFESIGSVLGGIGLVLAAPFVVLAAGLVAVSVAVGAKWLLIGRYRAGDHPLWSFFVWRDEIINTVHEQLAGAWLLSASLGTPLIPAYLRAMGSRVGTNVWFESLAVTEYDLVELHDGCAVNRGACVQTHLFHDRLLRMGPASFGQDSTLGPKSALLPDASIGAGCTIGAGSVVLRGEKMPPQSRWQGVPVECP